ncbi:phage integrase N-terminal SAM-like domain-containing protein, partial [Pseudoalteromonas citrea]
DNNEVVEYLDYLVLKCNVSPKTQATALNALSFLYKKIIKQDLCPNLTFVRSKRQSKLPIVMTP